MKYRKIRKLVSCLLIAAMCMSLCTGLDAKAGDINEDDWKQEEETAQDEPSEQEAGEESAAKEPAAGEIEETGETDPQDSKVKTAGKQTVSDPGQATQEQGKAAQEQEQIGQTEQSEDSMQMSEVRQSASGISDPRIVPDTSMKAGQKVTWDCVWFGSYPQAEVVPSAADYTALDEGLLQDGDIIEDKRLYDTLKNLPESQWDSNGDAAVNGSKYRRIKQSDATYTSTRSSYYHWSDSDTYHYFKYESIKWRVLKVDRNQAFLLSDITLDDQKYNTVNESITWEASTIRSWLNGYGASSNKQGEDYGSKSFIGNAFSEEERSAVANTSVVNDDNIFYGTEGGNNTTDKVFLLSDSETYGDSAVLGFASLRDTNDEARRCKSSTYVKAMGTYTHDSNPYKGNDQWWLRSPGRLTNYAALVTNYGYIDYYGLYVDRNYNGVRAALNLNLSSSCWEQAGTVCSDGTVDEITPPETDEPKMSVEIIDNGDTQVTNCTVTLDAPDKGRLLDFAYGLTCQIDTDDETVTATEKEQAAVAIMDGERTAVASFVWEIKDSKVKEPQFTPYFKVTFRSKGGQEVSKEGGDRGYLRIYRDTNSFPHGDMNPADNTGTGYPTSEELLSRLSNGATDEERLRIMSGTLKEWGGSCFGVTATIVFSNFGLLDTDSYGSPDGRYYALESPKENLKLRNIINFYHLSQYREECENEKLVYNNVFANIAKDILPEVRNGYAEDFWESFLPAVRKAVKEKRCMTLSMGYGKTLLGPLFGEDGSGHSVAVCGIDESDEDYHIVKLYDVNNRTKYLYLYISKDYKHFFCSYETDPAAAVNEKKYAADNDWKYLGYRDKDLLEKIAGIGKGRRTASMRTKSVEAAGQDREAIYISAFTKLRLENSKGQYLYFDGTEFSGDIKLYDISLLDNESGQIFRFVVDKDESYRLTEFDGKAMLGGFINHTFYSAEATNADAITIDASKGIFVSGDDVTFSGEISNESNDKLVKVSGESEGDVIIKRDGSKVDVKSEGNMTDTTVDQVDADGDSTRENYGSTDSITVNTENEKKDEPFGDDKKPAEEKDQKVSSISISSNLSGKIAAGKKVKLTAAVSPANAANKAVAWTSSNKKVATVNSKGIVTLKKKSGGKSVTITATAQDGSNVKAAYKITSMKGIVKKVAVSGKKTVKAGKTLKLKGKVTATKKANKKLKWKSSNTKYATVSSSGKVKTLKAGKGKKVKITAEATDGSGKKKSVTIKIK